MPHTAHSSSRQESRRRYYERKQEARKARKMADRSSNATSEYSAMSLVSVDSPSAEEAFARLPVAMEERVHPVEPLERQIETSVPKIVSTLDFDGQTEMLRNVHDQKPPTSILVVPTITEDELLSFQSAHFGDDSRPDTFFVDPSVALNYEPWLQQEEQEWKGDNLGHYMDGTKRTLTDAQIALFRHTELQELLRQAKLKQEEELETRAKMETDNEAVQVECAEQGLIVPGFGVEGGPTSVALQTRPRPSLEEGRQKSPVMKDNASRSSTSTSRTKRKKPEVPYADRHKRRWEEYIEGEDEKHGSLTHRRIIRELDDQAEEMVDMDY